jgi:UPF0716 protein FxsA
MSLVKWAFVGVLLLPAAEIAAFLLVALAIGWFWAVCLFLATSILGVFVLRRVGRRDLDRLRSILARDGLAAIGLDSPGIGSAVGGFLLVIPGFITDIVGALLLFPPIRRRFSAATGRAIDSRRPQQRPAVIDLTPEEWRQISERAIDDTRKHRPQRE